MRKTFGMLLLIGTLLGSIACKSNGIAVPSSNPEVAVERVTTFEDVTLYRVIISETTVLYVATTSNPNKTVEKTEWKEQQGKNNVDVSVIPTAHGAGPRR